MVSSREELSLDSISCVYIKFKNLIYHFLISITNSGNSQGTQKGGGRTFAYPLTLPNVNPEINQRLRNINTTTTGILTITAPAE